MTFGWAGGLAESVPRPITHHWTRDVWLRWRIGKRVEVLVADQRRGSVWIGSRRVLRQTGNNQADNGQKACCPTLATLKETTHKLSLRQGVTLAGFGDIRDLGGSPKHCRNFHGGKMVAAGCPTRLGQRPYLFA